VASAAVKTWRLLPHDPDAVVRLSRQLAVPPLVAQLLLNRGVAEPDEARRFLDAPLSGLHPPELLPGVAEAADRLFRAARTGKTICVYGDYDVDGLSGSAILLRGLQLLGARTHLYVPHRLEEGYGLHRDALRSVAAAGASLVVTVDCGIASLEEADEARRLGLELIVTDHHEFKERLPAADVLVHPRLPGGSYPFGKLSGSAVAFKLAWALAQRASGSPKVTPRFKDYLLDAVSLASLGVVADVVALHGENRILVRHGLHRLSETPLPGLRALCRSAGLTDGAPVRASDIGFRLAPRLNAAGRLGSARQVVELLMTTDEERAVFLAGELEEKNAQRQKLEREMVAEARRMLESSAEPEPPAIVLASNGWHAGVLGIVASRLTDLYGRPTLLIAMQTERYPRNAALAGLGLGSGRSIPGFPLNEALAACDDLLLAHGGHPMAAGFKVRPEQLDAFRARFCSFAASRLPPGPPSPSLTLDAEAPLSAFTLNVVRDLDRLEPYGADNRKPIFLCGGLQVDGEPRKVGQDGKHLQFRLRQSGTVLKAIAFGMADRVGELLSADGACCLAFTPKINEWNGRVTVDLEVVDFQAGATARLG
jgi:single-stranded-DNA-specific exonuclease